RLQAARHLVGRAAALLNRRVAAFALLATVLGLYYAESDALWRTSVWWDVAWLACVLIPAVLALVYLVLPLWTRSRLLVAVLALVGLTALLAAVGLDAAAGFGNLAAATLRAFWF